MSSKKFNPFEDFQSDQIQRSSRKIFIAHYACRNADLNLTLVVGWANGFVLQIINSLMECWRVRLTLLDCKARGTQTPTHGLAITSRMHTAISHGQWNAVDSCFAFTGAHQHGIAVGQRPGKTRVVVLYFDGPRDAVPCPKAMKTKGKK